MKRRIALALGAIFFMLFVVAAPVAATTGAPAAPAPLPPGVPSDAVGVSILGVGTSGLAVTLDAGGTEEHDLVVSNHTTNLRLTIKISATDATGSVDSGPGSWLSFGDDVVQIDPHGATTVPMTVAIPHDTQPSQALAHVTAVVQTAVNSGDGSPVTGTAQVSFPVAITVRGTQTAQIAVADVHRVDQGSKHELALVLRNYGTDGANVSGHVRVGGQQPQTLKFAANLPGSRDTTLSLPWHAPPQDTATDLAVDVTYGGGDVASWSSKLGAAPTNLVPNSATTPPSAADTSADTSTDQPATNTTTVVKPSEPFWKKYLAELIGLAVLLAAGWFALEMKRSKNAPREIAMPQPFFMTPQGFTPGNNDATVELAKQLVALTEVVVRLATGTTSGADPPVAPGARAGPSPPPAADRDPPIPEPVVYVVPAQPEPEEPELEELPEDISRSESETPGDSARPETEAENDRELEPPEIMFQRLVELDRERRRLRAWMDREPVDEFGFELTQPTDEEGA